MRSRSVAFSEAAQSDLIELEAQLEPVAGKEVARRYVDRLVDYCWRLDLAPERGTPRADLWPGLHIVGFERRITIALVVTDDRVEILRIFRRGRDWETEFAGD